MGTADDWFYGRRPDLPAQPSLPGMTNPNQNIVNRYLGRGAGMPAADRAALATEDKWKGMEPIQSLWKNRAPSVQPQQMKMLMSASEIMRDYQPLEGDRQGAYDDREGELTNRSRMTPDSDGRVLTNPRIPSNDQTWLKNRWGSTNVSEATHYRGYSPMESDKQLWARKLDESQMPADEYAEVHMGGMMHDNRTPGWETLMGRSSAPQASYHTGRTESYDQAQYDQADYVQRKQDEHHWNSNDSLYDRLSHAMRPGGEGFTGHINLGTQFGDSGKPQVLGAHHRIAAMNDIDSERLLPVIHSQTIMDARNMGSVGWKYT